MRIRPPFPQITLMNMFSLPDPGVTNNVITSQVAGGVVAGLFPDTVGTPVQVLIQSDSFDSLEPAYSCPNSVTIMTNYKADNASWAGHLTAASGLYERLDAVSGIETNDTADWHTSFDQYVSVSICSWPGYSFIPKFSR